MSKFKKDPFANKNFTKESKTYKKRKISGHDINLNNRQSPENNDESSEQLMERILQKENEDQKENENQKDSTILHFESRRLKDFVGILLKSPNINIISLYNDYPDKTVDFLQNNNFYFNFIVNTPIVNIPSFLKLSTFPGSRDINRLVLITGTIIKINPTFLTGVDTFLKCLNCHFRFKIPKIPKTQIFKCKECTSTNFTEEKCFDKAFPFQSFYLQDIENPQTLSETILIELYNLNFNIVPGENVSVLGIVRLKLENKIFGKIQPEIFIEAHTIKPNITMSNEDPSKINIIDCLSPFEKQKFLIKNFVPEIMGNENIKLGLLLSSLPHSRTNGHKSMFDSNGHKSMFDSNSHESMFDSNGHKSMVDSNGHKSMVDSNSHKSMFDSNGHKSMFDSNNHKSMVDSKDSPENKNDSSLDKKIEQPMDQKVRDKRKQSHVLLIGTTGSGKTTFLKNMIKIRKAIYVNSINSTESGLGASVIRSSNSHGWELVPGALLLANNSLCLIDNFSYLTQNDKFNLLEVMEQRTLSINKASISATMKANCTVIAAQTIEQDQDLQLRKYNLVDLDKFNLNKNLTTPEEYVQLETILNLTAPLISRFDLIFLQCSEIKINKNQIGKLRLSTFENKKSKMTIYDFKNYIYDCFLNNDCSNDKDVPNLTHSEDQGLTEFTQAINCNEKQKNWILLYNNYKQSIIPFYTLRQLETLLRLTNSLKILLKEKSITEQIIFTIFFLFESTVYKTIKIDNQVFTNDKIFYEETEKMKKFLISTQRKK
ncbi:putative DNA-dependent ATPase MCM, Nucleic acid-binding, OB-fold, ATPase, AAA+ type, core protein [Pseudoloma neurophilia]|uniref:Putative DNA-dependent ATPase MCM, Nucleic acid-binding, OB-fold, ATPase, AAA+ type, core protein n=1 Tax=Pseudoloma neurophilia TaxID=146866 RepID=A0A0R0LWF5_9MICR|nr:putative DNA-dependent ATPase MCM, Nucleic acid-binding, OB-fold, ATPase, AAA+ type, core protein [Pseudoloma neurophilia]